MFESGGNACYLDRIVITEGGEAVIVSLYERSSQLLKGAVSSFILSGSAFLRYAGRGYQRRVFGPPYDMKNHEARWDAFYQPILCGKQKVWHGVMVSKRLGAEWFLTTAGREGADMYTYLMRNADIPLLPEWGGAIFQKMEDDRMLRREYLRVMSGQTSLDYPLFGEGEMPYLVRVDNKPNQKYLDGMIRELFDEGVIRLSEKRNRHRFHAEDLNDYMTRYGKTIVDHLQSTIVPKIPLTGEIDTIALKRKRLFPQQAAIVNGIVAHLRSNPYCLLVCGMGTGKTAMSISSVEKYYVDKWLRKHPGKTPRDAYTDPQAVAYRVIVMCPGHMVEKWAKEISEEIPFATAVIIRDFSQLVQLRKRGRKRTGKEFYVISKDMAKLSYTYVPAVEREEHGKRIYYKVCDSCGSEFLEAGDQCPRCRNRGWHFELRCDDCGEKFPSPRANCPKCGSRHISRPTQVAITGGAVCPGCGEILFPGSAFKEGTINPLWLSDFRGQTTRNSKCFWCGTSLWKPYVRPANEAGHKIKPQSWVRVTRFANKAKKAKTTEWVHATQLQSYKEHNQEFFIGEQKSTGGPRKFSPSLFIKREMKGYFDLAIFDEVHLYKGGGSAQGQSMEDLVRATDKQLALTGTIAGGMAEHLFYMLYRLDPRRMVEKGFRWNQSVKFTEAYGTIERMFERDEDSAYYNSSSRGRQMGQAKPKPGISPLVFTEFLLDRSVFLDITDMSKFLPELKETVVTVPPDAEEDIWFRDYNNVIHALKERSRQKGGMALLSAMLQFSLSYMDKPFGQQAVIHPFDGSIAAAIPQHPEAWRQGHLSSKEQKLIELLESELKEGRNCFVFAEFTGQPETNVTKRLKDIIEARLGVRTAILDSKAVDPEEREEWIHRQAEENGVKVVITNPRCVETGLDFVWDSENGVRYNYPTLIFYQLGYSLFTVIQASRRHYRLIQDRECHTYYMAWEGTIQATVIELIAQKFACTSAIQGQFSTEGLAAMASGVDEKTKLAQALASEDSVSGADLQGMFDVIGSFRNTDDTYDRFERMKTWRELIGEAEYEHFTDSAGQEAELGQMLEELSEVLGADVEEPEDSIPGVFVEVASVDGVPGAADIPVIPDFPEEEEEEPAAAAVCSFGAAAAGLDEALNFLNEDLESLFEEEEVQVTKKKKKKKEAKQEHPDGFLFSSLFD